MPDKRRSSQLGQEWKVVGFDTFAANSDPEHPEKAWYEIEEYDTEAKALTRAAKELRRTSKDDESIADKIYLIRPDGDQCLCVWAYCSKCKVGFSMKRTGRTKRKGWFRPKEIEYECYSCRHMKWMREGHVSLLTVWSHGQPTPAARIVALPHRRG